MSYNIMTENGRKIVAGNSGGSSTGTSGHTMVSTIDDVLTSTSAQNKVVNAYTISTFSNVYTEMIGATLTKGSNTIGKWFSKDETWDTTQMLQDDRLIEGSDEQLNIEIDFWLGEAQGTTFKANTTPLHITGYQWDSEIGAITIRCAETAPNDITVVIKITHIRERSE